MHGCSDVTSSSRTGRSARHAAVGLFALVFTILSVDPLLASQDSAGGMGRRDAGLAAFQRAKEMLGPISLPYAGIAKDLCRRPGSVRLRRPRVDRDTTDRPFYGIDPRTGSEFSFMPLMINAPGCTIYGIGYDD